MGKLEDLVMHEELLLTMGFAGVSHLPVKMDEHIN